MRMFSPTARFLAFAIVPTAVIAGATTMQAGEIHEASAAGDLAKVQRILDSKPDSVNTIEEAWPSAIGYTPLHWAARNGNKRVVEFLLSKGANVNARNAEGYTPLEVVAAYGGEKEIAELLLANGAEANAQDEHKGTPLHAATASGHKVMVEFLLAKGAKLDAEDSNGWTPLFFAAAEGNKEMIELLLARGAKINAKAKDGGTALNEAAFNEKQEAADLLLAKGAKPDIFAATILGKTDVVVALLHTDPTLVRAKSSDDSTPLHLAAMFGRKDVAKVLLANKAEVNARDKDGNTPLHFAALMKNTGDKETVELLLSNGAEVNAKDKHGLTPLASTIMLSSENGVADILRRHGGHE